MDPRSSEDVTCLINRLQNRDAPMGFCVPSEHLWDLALSSNSLFGRKPGWWVLCWPTGVYSLHASAVIPTTASPVPEGFAA